MLDSEFNDGRKGSLGQHNLFLISGSNEWTSKEKPTVLGFIMHMENIHYNEEIINIGNPNLEDSNIANKSLESTNNKDQNPLIPCIRQNKRSQNLLANGIMSNTRTPFLIKDNANLNQS